MNHEQMLEKFPEVLNRIEGRGAGAKAKNKAAEDIEVITAFGQYALQNALRSGFPATGHAEGEGRRSFGVNPGDQDQVVSYLRSALESGTFKDPDSTGITETEGRGESYNVETAELGEESRGDVTIPTPNDPRNVTEWIPLALWAVETIGKLVAKWKKK